jgi:hypothetical protein
VTDNGNYTKWCELFLVTLDKYIIISHVDGADIGSSDVDSAQDDFVVLSWPYESTPLDIFNTVMFSSSSAQ